MSHRIWTTILLEEIMEMARDRTFQVDLLPAMNGSELGSTYLGMLRDCKEVSALALVQT